MAVKILIVDDSKTNLAYLSATLTELNHTVLAASNGEQAIEQFKTNKPDLIILDVLMEGMDGFECARRIRSIDADEWIPIIFLSADVNDESIEKGINAGGDDYLTKPFSEVTLKAKIKAMQRIADMRKKIINMSQKLAVLSTTDPLTGLYNRLQFDIALKEKIAEADRYHNPVVLFFIDLDKFKPVNDTYGHHIGDQVLAIVAKRMRSSLRVNDFIARLGGDEFAVIINHFTDLSFIEHLADKILNAISEPYKFDNLTMSISASIGIAVYPQLASSMEELIKKADLAMYYVKHKTRNDKLIYSDDLLKKPKS